MDDLSLFGAHCDCPADGVQRGFYLFGGNSSTSATRDYAFQPPMNVDMSRFNITADNVNGAVAPLQAKILNDNTMQEALFNLSTGNQQEVNDSDIILADQRDDIYLLITNPVGSGITGVSVTGQIKIR